MRKKQAEKAKQKRQKMTKGENYRKNSLYVHSTRSQKEILLTELDGFYLVYYRFFTQTEAFKTQHTVRVISVWSSDCSHWLAVKEWIKSSLRIFQPVPVSKVSFLLSLMQRWRRALNQNWTSLTSLLSLFLRTQMERNIFHSEALRGATINIL